ncbi:Aste57867_9483 [Aphanomyces stellatus]|uniref:Aste57867_9483 protein n=1 Tax=Aphanomyces stellatus TaxID=120398 RepID=A0A485KNB3_9STRA|nr:hypothetical protein As57867_009446 [Aphanomyces stellatus]VFT86362.1 Aste57867_9483 [Aphanomyces stellatus]
MPHEETHVPTDDAPFHPECLKPPCGPSTGGTKIIIHGSGFSYSGRTSTKCLIFGDEAGAAIVRFMHGEKILATAPVNVLNSSKIEMRSVPYTRALLSATCETWGVVTLCVSINGSPYVPCKQPFRYYEQPSIFAIEPRALSHAAVLADSVVLAMRLSIAPTPQTPLSPAQRHRLAHDMRLHPLCMRIRTLSSSSMWSIAGQLVPDDDAGDGIPFSLALPSNLPVGVLALEIAFNGVDFVALTAQEKVLWTDWGAHAHFSIFAPPQLRAVAPSCCYYMPNQKLTLDGTDLISYSQHDTAIVRFHRLDDDNLTAQALYSVTASMDRADSTTLCIATPRFNDPGYFILHVSVNDGVHFTTLATPLLVYLKPCCEYLTPEYGVSMGATDLHLRLSFLNPRAHDDHPNIALEEADFADRGHIAVRFLAVNSSTVLHTVRAAISSCRKFIHCSTPRNNTVESFRYSQTEAMALQLTLDGVVYFPLMPKKPFSYYAPPKLLSYSTSQGPIGGGTTFHLHVAVSIPDTFACQLRFRGMRPYILHDVPVTKSADGRHLTCVTPPWQLEAGDHYTMALVELTLNGVDYSSDRSDFTPCTNPHFQGHEHHFLYYDPPLPLGLSPRFLSTQGHSTLSIHGVGLVDYGGPIQVAFSDGHTTTKYVDGRLGKHGHLECHAPPFAPGRCNVAVSLNGQQFSGQWTASGHCIGGPPDIDVVFLHEPIFTALAPARGPVGGGTDLRIFGENFVETGQILVRFVADEIGYEEIVPGTVAEYVVSVVACFDYYLCCCSGVLECITPASPIPQRVVIHWSISGEFLKHTTTIKPAFVFE